MIFAQNIFSQELIEEAVKQGAGFFLALIMFAVWLYEKRTNEKQLTGIIKERKNDRDQLLILMGKIEGHLNRADSFEEFAKQVLKEKDKESTPKRRLLDRKLSEAMARITEAESELDSLEE